jgi:hypothetical protein
MQKSAVFLALLLFIILTNVVKATPSVQTEDGQVYIVQAEDWLSKLAEKFYGDPLSWKIIQQATEKKAREDDSFARIYDPNLIEVGQKLWIPRINFPEVPSAIFTVQDDLVIDHSGSATLPFKIGMEAPSTLWESTELVAGNYAYRLWVGDCTGYSRFKHCDSGLTILDIADPATPTVSTYTTPDVASDIVKVVNYVYIAWHSADTLGRGGVKILNVSEASNPIEVGKYETRRWVQNIILYQQYMYLFTPFGLEIVDVSNPSAPRRVGELSSGVPINGAIEGRLMYLDWGTPCGWVTYPLECEHDLRVLDISNPASPREIATYDIPSPWYLDYYSLPKVQALVIIEGQVYIPIPSVDFGVAMEGFNSQAKTKPELKYAWVVFHFEDS